MVKYYDIYAIDADEVTEPVTIQEAKSWLKVDYADDDTIIEGLIKGARETIEQFTSLALVDKKVGLIVDTTIGTPRVILPYGTASNIVITDFITDDLLVVNEGYAIKNNSVFFESGGLYTIVYEVYVLVNKIPASLKEAILMEVAERYNSRGENNKSSGISEAAKAKAQTFVMAWL